MNHIGWIIVSAGTAVLIGIIMIWRMLRGKRPEYPLREEFSALRKFISSPWNCVWNGQVNQLFILRGWNAVINYQCD